MQPADESQIAANVPPQTQQPAPANPVSAPSPLPNEQDLKKIAELVYARNAELVRLDKMKDEFVALASHELRTPLTIIKNYLWMVINQNTEPVGEKSKQYVEIALKSAERLVDIVNDILTISSIENGRIKLVREEIDIVSLIEDIIKIYSIQANERHVALHLETELISQLVMIDKLRFRQVIVNLLSNSLKFTPAQGSITIGLKIQNDDLVVFVKDTGPGIPKDKIGILFTKFGKIDEPYAKLPDANGTGLGLYISQLTIQMHGGKITAESEEGHGATFSVTIPLHPQEQTS